MLFTNLNYRHCGLLFGWVRGDWGLGLRLVVGFVTLLCFLSFLKRRKGSYDIIQTILFLERSNVNFLISAFIINQDITSLLFYFEI